MTEPDVPAASGAGSDTPPGRSNPGRIVARDTPVDRLLDWIALVCKIVTGVALVVLTVIFGWLVFGRYVLNSTPTWVEQVSLLLVMVITFLGAAVGVREHSHLGVSYFRLLAPKPVRKTCVAICHIALFVFGAVMMWQSTQLAIFKWGSLIPLIGISEGFRAVPIAICGGLIALFSIGNLIALARGYDEDLNPLE